MPRAMPGRRSGELVGGPIIRHVSLCGCSSFPSLSCALVTHSSSPLLFRSPFTIIPSPSRPTVHLDRPSISWPCIGGRTGGSSACVVVAPRLYRSHALSGVRGRRPWATSTVQRAAWGDAPGPLTSRSVPSGERLGLCYFFSTRYVTGPLIAHSGMPLHE